MSEAEKITVVKREVDSLNKILSESLLLNIKEKDTPTNIKLAQSKMRCGDTEAMNISNMAKIIISQNPGLTNGQIATKLIKELSNSHPNRFIKKLAKRMVRHKWGEKHEG